MCIYIYIVYAFIYKSLPEREAAGSNSNLEVSNNSNKGSNSSNSSNLEISSNSNKGNNSSNSSNLEISNNSDKGNNSSNNSNLEISNNSNNSNKRRHEREAAPVCFSVAICMLVSFMFTHEDDE